MFELSCEKPVSASEPDSLDEVPRHPSTVPLVKVRGPDVRMPKQGLNFIGRNSLVVQVRRNRDAETVRRELSPKSRSSSVSPHHPVDVVPGHGAFRKLSAP